MRFSSILASLAAGCSTLISLSYAADHVLTPRDLTTLCPPSDDGKFKCVSSTQFVICLGARTVIQNMAAGVPCVDSTYNAGAAVQKPAAQPQPPASQPLPGPRSPAVQPPDPNTLPPGYTPLVTAPAASPSPKPAATPNSDPNFDPVHHGTKTGQTFDCPKKVKQIGLKTLKGFFYCVDSTHYTVCLNKYPSDIYNVPQGTMCQQLRDGSFIIGGHNGFPG